MKKKKGVDISIFDHIEEDPKDEHTKAEFKAGNISSEEAFRKLMTDRSVATGAFKALTDFSGPELQVPKVPAIQLEKLNQYASAKSLLKSLKGYYTDWSKTIKNGFQIVIYVVLANGVLIRVNKLIEEGFNGIAVEGDFEGKICLLLLQQSSLQFLCIAESVTPKTPRRNVGFIFAEARK